MLIDERTRVQSQSHDSSAAAISAKQISNVTVNRISGVPANRIPEIHEIRAAAEAMADAVDTTPCVRSHALSEVVGAEVFVKFENLQRTGSFKVRGAHTRLSRLTPEERVRGVIAASAGNHAQGVAYHAARMNVPTTIVMPVTTPEMKVRRTQELGARVVMHGSTIEEAMLEAIASSAKDGSVFVHPYDDPDVITGQGTVALEMLEAFPALDAFVVPGGGGGLIAGMSIVAKAHNPRIEMYAARSSAVLSAAGVCGVSYLADGIAVARFGDLPQAILERNLTDTLLVDDAAISQAMLFAIEELKTVVEGAAATAIAVLVVHREHFRGKRVGIVLSGGNIDHSRLSTIIGKAA
jgi:threonine dehydratase